jgi:hypothetical protein
MKKWMMCTFVLAPAFACIAPAFAGCPAGTHGVEVGTTVVNGTTYILTKCVKNVVAITPQ